MINLYCNGISIDQGVRYASRTFQSSNPKRAHLFNEAEILAATATEAQDVALLPAPARGKRSPLPPELERVEIIHDVPESERQFSAKRLAA